jgi:hypothetical protein
LSSWSEYGNGADDSDNGCAGDGNEEHWYMGRTQCYRANVAYTLYGIPKGESEPTHACKAKYFINSFFTTQGIEYFSASAELDIGAASSYCAVQESDDDGDNNQDNGDGGQSYEHNEVLYPNAQSYTTTCSTSGTFVQSMFQGAYCSGPHTKVLNSLDRLNRELEYLDCVEVYSANGEQDVWDFGYYDDDGTNDGDDGYYDQGNQGDQDQNEGNNDARERRMEDEGADEGADNGGIYSLLAYSEACSTLEYPLACPDPWGAKKILDYNPMSSNESSWQQISLIDWLALSIFLVALLALMLSCCCYGEKTKRRRWRRKARDGNTNEKGNSDDDDHRSFGDRVRGMGRLIRKKVFRRKG